MEKFRVYLAEFLGTMLLVALGTGVAVFAPANQQGVLPTAMAFGLAVVVAAYAFGSISGAHLNPAVSLAMAINKRMSWVTMIGYVGAQILGAFAGSAILYGVMNSFKFKGSDVAKQIGGFGQTQYEPAMIKTGGAIYIEAILTFMFVLIILMVTSAKFGNAMMAPLAIGFTLVVMVMIGITFTGASLNPARSLAPAVFNAIFGGDKTALMQMGVYTIGPLLGGAAAAFVAKFAGSEDAIA